MKNLFKKFVSLTAIFILLVSLVSKAYISTPSALATSCTPVDKYVIKSSDSTSEEANFDFNGSKTSVTISADSGYTITEVWLDVDDDGHSGYFQYGTTSGSYNPNPGDEINSAKARVVKTCVTPTPTPTPTPQHVSVTICHATGSSSNPYTQITVDDDAVDGNGNGNADHNRDDHQDGEDIIPAGIWDADGRNWDANGQGIWNNECNVPQVTPTSTPTNTPTPTDTPTPTPTNTPTPTVTVTETPTPTPGDCENRDCDTPTPTPTVTVTSTPTPTQSTPNTGGPGDGRSDGLSDGRSDGRSSSPQKQGEVLGISTLPNTGNFASTIATIEEGLGAVVAAFGVILYGKKSKKAKKSK